jgi:oxygen-independent coproporphyrinogen-3 oxidase
MEADPGTFDADRLRQYMALGLTRFSVGVQAFQEARAVPHPHA